MSAKNEETREWVIYNDAYIPTANYRRRVPRLGSGAGPYTPPPGRNWRLIEAGHGSTKGFYPTQQAAIQEAERLTWDGEGKP